MPLLLALGAQEWIYWLPLGGPQMEALHTPYCFGTFPFTTLLKISKIGSWTHQCLKKFDFQISQTARYEQGGMGNVSLLRALAGVDVWAFHGLT